jgi:hypothetical protein
VSPIAIVSPSASHWQPIEQLPVRRHGSIYKYQHSREMCQSNRPLTQVVAPAGAGLSNTVMACQNTKVKERALGSQRADMADAGCRSLLLEAATAASWCSRKQRLAAEALIEVPDENTVIKRRRPSSMLRLPLEAGEVPGEQIGRN